MSVRACVTQSIIIIGVVRLVSIPNPNFNDDQSERGILRRVLASVALYKKKGWRSSPRNNKQASNQYIIASIEFSPEILSIWFAHTLLSAALVCGPKTRTNHIIVVPCT